MEKEREKKNPKFHFKLNHGLQASIGIKTKQNSMQKQKPKVFNKFPNSKRKTNKQTQALLGKPTAEKLTSQK
jgi:hypothetical protein